MGVGDLHADGGTVSAHRARSEMARACTPMGTGAHGDEASQERRVRGRHGERRRERWLLTVGSRVQGSGGRGSPVRVRPGKRFGEVRRCRGISGRGRRDRGGVRTADEEGGGAMARNGSGPSVAPDPDPPGGGRAGRMGLQRGERGGARETRGTGEGIVQDEWGSGGGSGGLWFRGGEIRKAGWAGQGGPGSPVGPNSPGKDGSSFVLFSFFFFILFLFSFLLFLFYKI